jgi:hypothetical protein
MSGDYSNPDDKDTIKRDLEETWRKKREPFLAAYMGLTQRLINLITNIQGLIEGTQTLVRDSQYHLPPNEVEFLFETVMPKVQHDLEFIKSTMKVIVYDQNEELNKALLAYENQQNQLFFRVLHGRKGGAPRQDRTALICEAQLVIEKYLQHNRQTSGAKKTIADVYREVKTRSNLKSELRPVPTEQHFRRLLKQYSLGGDLLPKRNAKKEESNPS